MRHANRVQKLSRSRGQRLALKRSLVRALFLNEQIKTTLRKAKAASSEVDHLITIAKKDDLHSRRLVNTFLNDHKLTKHVFDNIAPRFKDLSGGYTRVLKFINRKGDNAQLAILELTKRTPKQAIQPEVVSNGEDAAVSEKKPKSAKAKKGLFSRKSSKDS